MGGPFCDRKADALGEPIGVEAVAGSGLNGTLLPWQWSFVSAITCGPGIYKLELEHDEEVLIHAWVSDDGARVTPAASTSESSIRAWKDQDVEFVVDQSTPGRSVVVVDRERSGGFFDGGEETTHFG